jgi:integrase
MALTAIQVKNAKTGRHADGKGLYLLVKPSGAKSWVLRIVVNGRRRDFGLGSVDLVSLQDARDKALEGRKMVRAGFDPLQEWKRVTTTVPTFEAATRQYHENVKQGWKNGKHGAQWLSTLETHAFPEIGKLPVSEVDAAAIQRVLLPIWLKVPETARRVRQRVGAVLDYAHGQGWRASEAPLRAVGKGLPKQTAKRGHFAAMPYADLPAFMSGLRESEASVGRLALQFTILTAARSGEVRGATWEEIDLDAATWTIPAERMKAGETHVVPLSPAALAVLQQVQAFRSGVSGEPVFPGLKGKPLSDMTLAKALRLAGGDGVTVHGMRSSFRDWVAEKMPTVPGDVAEAALAHAIGNKTEAAYRRAKYLDQRRDLMDAWGAYLNGRSNVIALVVKR